MFYNPSLDSLPERGLLSAQLTLGFDDWELEGYATNLTNKEYVSGQSGQNELYGAPREFGGRPKARRDEDKRGFKARAIVVIDQIAGNADDVRNAASER